MPRTVAMPADRYLDEPNALLFGVQFTNRTATVAVLTPVQLELFSYFSFTIDGVVPPVVDPLDTFPEVSEELGKRLRMWTPSTGYAPGQFALSPAGQTIKAKTAHTSAATFDASKWDAIGGGTSSTPVADTSAYLVLRPTAPSAAERTSGTLAYVDTSVVPPVLKGWDGSAWVPLAGAGSGTATTPTTTPTTGAVSTTAGTDGTFTTTGTAVSDNGDGTYTVTDSTATANADGTFTLAA